ncbi:OLC1v1011316C1 [Oldenlandia corymbosa var. corymbosa]|uniref:OLC1v1011316C1 n=1 Tax=Oldenlandia corymbosa var. corymbosa TaxID=529605 RepID=A0AAV1DTB9_OLDCO|nr:OLC1v1011316C1 [Oldenlandia corymbosa var. corymbosa]
MTSVPGGVVEVAVERRGRGRPRKVAVPMTSVPGGDVEVAVERRDRGRTRKAASLASVYSNPPFYCNPPPETSQPLPGTAIKPNPFHHNLILCQRKEKSSLFFTQTFRKEEDGLIQFWNPVRDKDGYTVLSLSEADRSPGLGRATTLYTGGLHRYRSHSLNQYGCRVVEDDGSPVGPFGRVLKQNFPEYCPNIECYSTQEFPLRGFAITCGIKQYWALPLYECVSCTTCVKTESLIPFNRIIRALKLIGLGCPYLFPRKSYDVS